MTGPLHLAYREFLGLEAHERRAMHGALPLVPGAPSLPRRCPLGASAHDLGVWGGTTMTERGRVQRAVAEEVTTPERVITGRDALGREMTTRLRNKGGVEWAEGESYNQEVADRLEASFDERYVGWIERGQQQRSDRRQAG